jgi:hypothetical protein
MLATKIRRSARFKIRFDRRRRNHITGQLLKKPHISSKAIPFVQTKLSFTSLSPLFNYRYTVAPHKAKSLKLRLYPNLLEPINPDTKVGSPERRPRCCGAKITGGAHKIPLVEHEQLVERESGEVTVFVGVGASANDALKRPGGNKERLKVRARVGVPGDVTGLSASAAHLGPACVEQAGLLGLHGGELGERTGPTIARGGHHGGGAIGGAMRAFEQFGDDK